MFVHIRAIPFREKISKEKEAELIQLRPLKYARE